MVSEWFLFHGIAAMGGIITNLVILLLALQLRADVKKLFPEDK